MNISLQTNSYSSSNQYISNSKRLKNNQNYYYSNQQTFKGLTDIPTNSKLLDPLKKLYANFTYAIGRNYTLKLYTSPVAKFLANHIKNLKGVVDHMQVMGSVIISGMYMRQTLTNKDFDDDRKRTLAINQGLTFALSTLGSYFIDSSLDKKWEQLTAKYAEKKTGDKDFSKKLNALNKSIIEKAEQEQGISFKKMPKDKRPKLYTVIDYIEERMPDDKLEGHIKGMGILKKLIVFGTIYRFVSPVLVTPIATWIGNNLCNKKKPEAKNIDSQNNTQQQNVVKK